MRYLLVLLALTSGVGSSSATPNGFVFEAARAVARAKTVVAVRRPSGPADVVTRQSGQEDAVISQAGQEVARSLSSGQPAEARLRPGPFEIRLPRVDVDDGVHACASTDPTSLVNGRTGAVIDRLGCFESAKYTVQDDGPVQSVLVGVGDNNLYFDSDDRTDTGTSTLLRFRGAEYVEGAAGPFYLVILVDHDRDGLLDRGEYYQFHVEPVAAGATGGATPPRGSAATPVASGPAETRNGRTATAAEHAVVERATVGARAACRPTTADEEAVTCELPYAGSTCTISARGRLTCRRGGAVVLQRALPIGGDYLTGVSYVDLGDRLVLVYESSDDLDGYTSAVGVRGSDGSVIWRSGAVRFNSAVPFVYDAVLYVASAEHVGAIDVSSGATVWEASGPSWNPAALALRVHPETGEVLVVAYWTIPSPAGRFQDRTERVCHDARSGAVRSCDGVPR